MTVSICTYEAAHFEGVKAMWRELFSADTPWHAPEVTVPAKLKVQPDLFVVAVDVGALDAGRVVGSIFGGYDGHRGWLNGVGVRKEYQGTGVGAALVREMEQRLGRLGCPKINLQVRTSNAAVIGFYQKLGYAVEERISLGKRMNAASFEAAAITR